MTPERHGTDALRWIRSQILPIADAHDHPIRNWMAKRNLWRPDLPLTPSREPFRPDESAEQRKLKTIPSNGSVNYGWEKLYESVTGLMTGTGTLESRLYHAIANLGVLSAQNAEDLPESIREDFTAFLESMSSQPAEDNESTILATLRTMDWVELSIAAEKS